MPRQLIFILTILMVGCGTTKVATAAISENNKDALILAILINDHLKRTKARTVDLNEILQKDSLKRITNNFEKIELKFRGGYISIYYKLSNTRNNNLQLTDSEKKRWLKWSSKKIDPLYNGEIRLAYSERFYHLKKIVVQKN